MKEQEMRDRKGFKETKLGWIPEDWEIIRFDEIATFFSGGTPKTTNKNYYSGDIPFIKSGEIDKKKTKEFINEEGLNNSSAKWVKEKDLLMALYGANSGEVAISKINGAINQAILCIRPKPNYDNVFLYNLLLNEKSNIIRKYLQGGQGNLSGSIIKKIKINSPKLTEQKAIANCLSTWDTAITKQDALIKAKQQLKKALMQQLLSGKKRLSGFSGEWTTNRFDYFLNYAPRPVEKPKTAFTKLGIRSHCKGTFQNKNFKPSAIAIDTMYLVKPNDLIVNITFAWEGAVAIVKQEDNGALVSHRFPTYEFIEGISDVGFFNQFTQSKWFRYQLDLISPGGAGRNRVLSKKELNKLKIRLPDYKEQNAIAQVLNTADQEISLLTNQRNQLQLQKKGLMQQLLTGKKRLK